MKNKNKLPVIITVLSTLSGLLFYALYKRLSKGKTEPVNIHNNGNYLVKKEGKYRDKVIWITGASSGIGEALVYEYSQENAKIILSSRNEDELQRVKNNCKGNKENIFVLPLDLANTDIMNEKVEEVIKKFGKVDYLINNGGISQRALALDTSFEGDRKIMNINYFGTVALTKAVLPKMLNRKKGHIVVISSVTGKFGTPIRTAYAASKHALHGFFDSLRAEVWKDNIKVTIICPGFVKTNITKNAYISDNGENFSKESKGITAEKCAKKIVESVEKGKEEVFIGSYEVFGVYLKRYFPTLFSKYIKKAKVI